MRLLWFVSTLEDTLFLKRFSKHCALTIDVFNINFITRVDLIAHKGVHIFPRYKKHYSHLPIDDDLHRAFNVLSGRLKLDDAQKAYRATMGQLKDYSKSIANDKVVFIIPSGRHVHHVAASRFARTNQIKRVFINYSNFPGYTFFDPEGTDCLASIFRDPKKLERLYFQYDIDVEETFNKFAELKHQQKSIPQKSNNGLTTKIKKMAFLFDTALQYSTNIVGDRRISLRKIPQDEVITIEYSSIQHSEPFLFFPLQVSTDQQVLVNYEGGSIYKAIDQAYDYAKAKGLTLFVREHPAEANKNAVRAYLEKLAKNHDFCVTDASVSDLLSCCQEVITINSTVGLESRINRRPVHFLGKSFYEKATDLQLAYYLKYYLFTVDYHNPMMNKKQAADFIRRFVI